MVAAISPGAYWSAVALAALGCAALCGAARRHPGRWCSTVARLIGALLLADALSFGIGEAVAGTWSAQTSLPLALCDVGVLVAALACWWRVPLLVELTYFWGLAGTLQAVITPDLNVGFPHLVFFQYVVGHLGIVLAALFLVVGMRNAPRPGAVPRVFTITVLYTACVGLVDGLTGANYMFLRAPPRRMDALARPGPVAVVHGERGGRRPRAHDPARRAVLAGASVTEGVSVRAMADSSDHDHEIDTGKGTFALTDLGSLMPGMAEVMPLVGGRIWKCYYAGQARNRPLARFQLKEAVNLMEKGAFLRPKYAENMEKFINEEVAAVGKCIDAEDWEGFESAFGAMVDAANAYHDVYDKSFLRWKIPDAAPPDLDMTPRA